MNNVFDLHHQIEQRTALAVGVINTETTTPGIIIDTAGFTALEFFLLSGNITDGAYAVSLQHGNDSGLSDVSAVSAADVLGNADFTSADDNIPKRIGYVGGKRYVRLSIVSTSIFTGGGTFGGVVLLGGPSHQPIAD